MGQRILAILAVLSAACSASPPTSISPRAEPADEVENVIDWALGADRRTGPPAVGDAFLLRALAGKPIEGGTRVTQSCIHASSFMPSPPSDGRIFFLIDGMLYAQRVTATSPADPAPLDGADAYKNITRLLAFGAEQSPLSVLAAAHVPGAAKEELWLITVSDTSILQIKRLKGHPAFRSKEAFFQSFYTPRCVDGGERCLLLTSFQSDFYIDVEPTRGGAPQPLQEFRQSDIRDATWASSDGTALYLLVGCPSSDPPPPR